MRRGCVIISIIARFRLHQGDTGQRQNTDVVNSGGLSFNLEAKLLAGVEQAGDVVRWCDLLQQQVGLEWDLV